MSKRKLTSAEKAEKRRRKREFKSIMIGGKQKRVRRESSFDITSADDITLHQLGLWHIIEERKNLSEKPDTQNSSGSSDNIQF
jgi:hypothetical protein